MKNVLPLIIALILAQLVFSQTKIDSSEYTEHHFDRLLGYHEKFVGGYSGMYGRNAISFFMANASSIYISKCDFSEYTDFSKFICANDCVFGDSTVFEKKADFVVSRFNGLTIFGCIFKDSADFTSTKFDSGVKFWDNSVFPSHFYGTATFSECDFGKFASFERMTFEKKVEFHRAKFHTTPNFEYTVLPDTLDLSYMVLDKQLEDINLSHGLRGTDIHHSGKCVLYVEGTDLSRLVLPSNIFTLGEIPSASYDDRALEYEQIIKKCHEVGMTDSEEGWSIEYKKVKNYHEYGLIGGFLINFINEWYWNFGFSRERILFVWLPAFFLAFWLVNFLQLERLIAKVYFDEDFGKSFKGTQPKSEVLEKIHNSSSFRMKYSFFLTSIIYFNIKMKQESINYENQKGMFYIYFLYAIGTLNVVFGIIGFVLKNP